MYTVEPPPLYISYVSPEQTKQDQPGSHYDFMMRHTTTPHYTTIWIIFTNSNYFIKVSPFVIMSVKQVVCNLKLQKPLRK